MREPCKGCHAVEQFHSDSPHTNSKSGAESHFSTFIDNRYIDRPYGDGCDQSTEEARETRLQDKK